MLFGYARVSRECQDLSLQINALKDAGVAETEIFTDKVSGAKAARPGLDEVLASMRREDTLVVWRLDRLGRSFKHLIEIVQQLKERGIKFKSIQEGMIDTTTASGELVFNMFAVLAQFERGLTQERIYAGLKAARARGKKGGRPPLDPKNSKVKMAKLLHKDHTLSVTDICNQLDISKCTLYRYLKM